MGHFSDFPEPKAPHLEPDYRKLYSYIAAVMDDDPELPELTSLGKLIVTSVHFLAFPGHVKIKLFGLLLSWNCFRVAVYF